MKNHKNYECICAFCEKSANIYDEDSMMCKQRGIVAKDFSCNNFIYDPLKRIPPKAVSAPKLDFIDIE